MSISDIVTLVIATAALITSCVSAFEMVRQSKNAVRPAIVILEKFADNNNPKGQGYALFLVNMGNAMAMNVRIINGDFEKVIRAAGDSSSNAIEIESMIRTEIAVNRRAKLGSHYSQPVLNEIRMLIWYVDVNGAKYFTRFNGEKHDFGRGQPSV